MANLILVALLIGISVAIATFLCIYWVELKFAHATQEKNGLVSRSIVKKLSEVLVCLPAPEWVMARWKSPRIAQLVMHADLALTVDDFVRLRWTFLWFGILGALWLGSSRMWDLVGSFLAIVLFTGAAVSPPVWLRWKIERHQLEIDLMLPNFLDRLILGLGAGLGFEQALRHTASTLPGKLGVEVRRSLRQIDRGHTRNAALENFQYRLPSQEIPAFVSAINQSDRLGTPLTKVLKVQSELLRSRRRRRAQEASRRLPILIIFPLVFCFLPALLIIYLAPPLLMFFLQE